MNGFAKSFSYAWTGLKLAWRDERNFKIELVIGILVLIAAYALGLSGVEFSIVALTCTLVLTLEILNTAFEVLSDKLHPNHDPHIAKAKDLMAAAVFVASIASVVVGIAIFWPHLF